MESEIEDLISKTKVVVEDDLSKEKLVSLIKIGGEDDRLDYKARYQIKGSRRTKDKVELVRDIVAMANTFGGYIILGVHEKKDGKKYAPEGLSDKECEELDISAICQQVESYVEERTNIQFRLHEIPEYENNKFGIIFVPPNPHSPLVFSKDGQYRDERTNENKLAFREGDIMVRKRASSERADQSDIRRLISDIRQREKTKWKEEILELLGEDVSYKRGTLKFDKSLYFLPPDNLEKEVIDLLDRGRGVSLRRYIRKAHKLFFDSISLISSEGDENKVLEIVDNQLLPILDNLVAIGLVFVDYGHFEYLTDIKQILYLICKKVENDIIPQNVGDTLSINKIWVWQEIIIRVYAIGALLVSKEKWEAAKLLIEQEIEWDEYYRKQYWSRYVLTMASRAEQLQDKGWVPTVVQYMEENEWIAKYYFSDRELMAKYVCQFDFIQCVFVEMNNSDRSLVAYPSFGIYSKRYTEPIILKLIDDVDFKKLLSKLTDEQLAIIIHELDKSAKKQFFRGSGWTYRSWGNKKIPKFISDKIPSDS